MTKGHRIRILINRLARIEAAEGWSGDLNPTQRLALDYLAQANRFSRSPSHVADYIGTTRGTMSQTLKTLVRKGYIAEERTGRDQRSISYALTDTGAAVAAQPNPVAAAFGQMSEPAQTTLEAGLAEGLRLALAANGGRSFGLCRSCAYHDAGTGDGYCTLLGVALERGDGDRICVEHQER